MQLNTGHKEALIDFLLDNDRAEALANRYAGFENIIILLVKDQSVMFPSSLDQGVEGYLEDTGLCNCLAYDLDGSIVIYKLDSDKINNNEKFNNYRQRLIHDIEKELIAIESEKRELIRQKTNLAEAIV